MTDPMRTLWTTPDPESRPLPPEAEPESSDTASIAEQAGFSLGPPTLASVSDHGSEDDDTGAGEAEAPVGPEAAGAELATTAAEEPSTHDAESDESETSTPFESEWDAEPSLQAEAGGRDAGDWDEDEPGWDPDGSAPVILGSEEPAARPSLVLAELRAWEAAFQSATRATQPETEPESAAETEPESEQAAETETDQEADVEETGAHETTLDVEPATQPGYASSDEAPPEATPDIEAPMEVERDASAPVETEADADAETEARPDAETAASDTEPAESHADAEAETVPEAEIVPEADAETEAEAAGDAEPDADARARALAAAWIPRSTPSPVAPVSSVFGGPAPWATPAAETVDGSATAGIAPSEDGVDLSEFEVQQPEPEPEEVEPFELDPEGADEDRWWDEPSDPPDATTSAADESTSLSDGHTLPEPEDASAAPQSSGDAPTPPTQEAGADAAARALPLAGADAAAGSAPDDESSWPPAPERSAPTEPLTGTGFAASGQRRRTPGILERNLEPPTGMRAFSVLSATPEAVPSRQPVSLVGEPTEASSGEPTTVDLGVSVDRHDEPPASQAAQTGSMTPEARLRAQFRQRVAAAAGAAGSTPAPNALWLLTGEPERTAETDDIVRRSAVVNIVLTVFAIIVVVVLVLGFLVLVADLL